MNKKSNLCTLIEELFVPRVRGKGPVIRSHLVRLSIRASNQVPILLKFDPSLGILPKVLPR